jgi:hypothetical protein
MVAGHLERITEACPRCAERGIVRVLWKGVYLSDRDRSEIRSERAILASPQVASASPAWLEVLGRAGSRLPEAVCVACTPEWLEVNRLALRDYELQLEKEQAVLAQDFTFAGQLKQQQERLQDQLATLVGKLLSTAETAKTNDDEIPLTVQPSPRSNT